MTSEERINQALDVLLEEGVTVRQLRSSYIKAALRMFETKRHAAKVLGLDRRSVYRELEKDNK